MRHRAMISLVLLALLLGAAPARAELEIEGVTFKAGKTRIERNNRAFKARELIWIAFTVTGFGYDDNVWLEESLKVLAPDGSVAYELPRPTRFKVEWDEELTEAFIQNNVQLQGAAPKGRYIAEITIEDRITEQTKVFREHFFIGKPGQGGGGATEWGGAAPAPAPTAGTLTIREPLLLARSRGGPRENNVFHPGARVFLRFEVGGAAVGDRGLVWLQQDLELLGPDGARVFLKKNISGVKQRVSGQLDWITLNNAVRIRKGSPTGTYRLVIHLRDKIAGSGATGWKEIYVRKK